MKPLSWILAGLGAGAALAYWALYQPRPAAANTGWNSVEEAAGKTWGWGAKNRIAGTGTNLAGKVKEGLGRFAGDPDLTNQGAADQAVGSVRDAVGSVAQAAGETIHQLNR
jgi:uncharacterized protein YjbJ (UPF0337 family)